MWSNKGEPSGIDVSQTSGWGQIWPKVLHGSSWSPSHRAWFLNYVQWKIVVWVKGLKLGHGGWRKNKREDPRVEGDFLHNFLKMDFDYLVEIFPKSSWWKTEKFSLNWVPESSNIFQSNVFCILKLFPFWFMKADSDRWRILAIVRALVSWWPHFLTEISKGW